MILSSDSISDNKMPSDNTHCDVESVDQVVDDQNVSKDEGSNDKGKSELDRLLGHLGPRVEQFRHHSFIELNAI